MTARELKAIEKPYKTTWRNIKNIFGGVAGIAWDDIKILNDQPIIVTDNEDGGMSFTPHSSPYVVSSNTIEEAN